MLYFMRHDQKNLQADCSISYTKRAVDGTGNPVSGLSFAEHMSLTFFPSLWLFLLLPSLPCLWPFLSNERNFSVLLHLLLTSVKSLPFPGLHFSFEDKKLWRRCLLSSLPVVMCVHMCARLCVRVCMPVHLSNLCSFLVSFPSVTWHYAIDYISLTALETAWIFLTAFK